MSAPNTNGNHIEHRYASFGRLQAGQSHQQPSTRPLQPNDSQRPVRRPSRYDEPGSGDESSSMQDFSTKSQSHSEPSPPLQSDGQDERNQVELSSRSYRELHETDTEPTSNHEGSGAGGYGERAEKDNSPLQSPPTIRRRPNKHGMRRPDVIDEPIAAIGYQQQVPPPFGLAQSGRGSGSTGQGLPRLYSQRRDDTSTTRAGQRSISENDARLEARSAPSSGIVPTHPSSQFLDDGELSRQSPKPVVPRNLQSAVNVAPATPPFADKIATPGVHQPAKATEAIISAGTNDVEISSPSVASEQAQPPRRTLEEILQGSGTVPNPGQVHCYRIKYMDVEQKKQIRHLRKLLHHQVLTQLVDHAKCVPLSQTTYISLEEMKLPASIDENERSVENVILKTRLIDSEAILSNDLTQSCYAENDFTKVFDGYQADGKISRRWKKFERPSIVSAGLPDRSSVSSSEKEDKQREAVIAALNEDSASEHTSGSQRTVDPRLFAIWFDHEVIDFDDISALVHSSGSVAPTQRTDAIISALLRGVLAQHGEDLKDIVLHGKCAFSHVGSTLPSGMIERKGLQGRMAMCSNDNTLKLTYKPCVARFLPGNQTVADLLISFFGQQRAAGADTFTLDAMNNLLRGVKIIVAVRDGFRKQSAVIRSIGQNVITRPTAFGGLKANIALQDIRYPTMPCVDVGESTRPFYYPAELCQITPNQMFHGEVPAVDKTDLFRVKEARIETNFVPKNGDPFPTVHEDDFKLFFVNLTSARPSGRLEASNDLRPEVWNVFQREVGLRFGAKLQKSVSMSKKVHLEYDSACNSIDKTLMNLAQLTHGSTGSKKVLIIAMPKKVPSEVATAIKVQCATVTGVQCCFVSVAELNKRYHPVNSTEMKKYTGQIVRKIFGRANIPEELQIEDRAKAQRVIEDKVPCRLYGIHVTNMQKLLHSDLQKKPGLDVSADYLATIVSASAQASDVQTTYHTFKVGTDGDRTLARQISRCLQDHSKGDYVRRDMSNGILRVALYVSGLPTTYDDDGALEAAIGGVSLDLIDPNVETDPKHKPVKLTIMMPYSQIAMVNDAVIVGPQANHDPSDVPIERFGFENQPMDDSLCDRFNLHRLTLGRAYRRLDGLRNKDGSLRDTAQIWHVLHRYFENDNAFHCLERRDLPDILYLAQAASKFGRSFVRFEPDATNNSGESCPYVVTPVHRKLRGSLFYA